MPNTRQRGDSSRANRLFAQNVAVLVRSYQDAHPHKTLATIAKEMGISLRSLANARSGAHAATLDTVQTVADFFRLDIWQLFMEDLPAEILLNPSLARIVRNVVRATVEGQMEGQAKNTATSERESPHRTSHPRHKLRA